MNLVTTFRLLIVVGLSCFAFTGITEFFYRPYISEEMAAFLEWDGYGSVFENNVLPDKSRTARIAVGLGMIIGLVLLLVVSFAQIAMLWFSRVGRTLSLLSAAAWIVLSPLFGVSASLPFENAAGYLATLCEGGALAMAYFSPLRERFEKVSNSLLDSDVPAERPST